MDINSTEIKENVVSGIVGAFLFSLVGGILWFVLYQIGYVASISGFVGVICAIKGFTFFAKTKSESTKCIVISTVVAIVVLVAAWYCCVAYDIYLAYQEWFAAGEVDFTLTIFESARAVPLFFGEQEVLIAYLKDLGIGLLFAGFGVFSYISGSKKKKKAAEAKTAAEALKFNINNSDSN